MDKLKPEDFYEWLENQWRIYASTSSFTGRVVLEVQLLGTKFRVVRDGKMLYEGESVQDAMDIYNPVAENIWFRLDRK